MNMQDYNSVVEDQADELGPGDLYHSFKVSVPKENVSRSGFTKCQESKELEKAMSLYIFLQ